MRSNDSAWLLPQEVASRVCVLHQLGGIALQKNNTHMSCRTSLRKENDTCTGNIVRGRRWSWNCNLRRQEESAQHGNHWNLTLLLRRQEESAQHGRGHKSPEPHVVSSCIHRTMKHVSQHTQTLPMFVVKCDGKQCGFDCSSRV